MAIYVASLEPGGDTPAETRNVPETFDEWAGSASCAACHPVITARWAKTAHALTIRDFAPDVVKKPFDGEVFTARDIDHKLGPGGSMRFEGPGGKLDRFDVGMVIGLRRIQMFTTTLKSGHIQVLPVFLEVPAKRWFDYTDFIFGGPNEFDVPHGSAYSWYGPHRNFSSRCGRCHMTDYEIGYDPDTGKYDTRWRERVVACEACHGPAGKHVHLQTHRLDGDDPIVNPAKLPVERANQVCGQCHAEATMVAPGFRPGDDLFAFFDVAGLEDGKHLFPDGRASELIHTLVQNMENRCGAACTQCHDPHGRGIPGDLYRPLSDDWTCTQCHADTPEHSHHKPGSAGARCVNCHMPRLVIEGGHGRVFDHTISIPSIVNTRDLGLPNACRSCHLEEAPGWEYPHFEQWYPEADKKNHRVPLAAAFAAARARRPGADELVKLYLADKNPVYRAGAAAVLARYVVDLRPMLEDPHPFVRRAAIEGVAAHHPEALWPLLSDPNMALRRAAAMALASRRIAAPFDFIAARPELRKRVLPVLEAAVQLRSDDADLHFTLAKLYEMEQRGTDAAAAMARYRLLRPWTK